MTTKASPPITTTPARPTTLRFAATTYSTVALPRPFVGERIVSQEFVFTICHAQFVAVVRATVFVEALASGVAFVGVSAKTQGVPAWMSVSVRSAICTVPVRLVMSKFSESA